MNGQTERSPYVHVERREGGIALFIDGDLQFDSADEGLYHESLALPALALAAERTDGELRVLICGGGDGLALREVLRFPRVAAVDLVDYSTEVVALGRTELAELNENAFEDTRVNVHIADAWEFLEAAAQYDVILCDFTVPRRADDTRVYSMEWYERIERALTLDGVAAFNGLSPQRTPEAFRCLNRTVRAAGLHPLPYRACIPSYRDQGYGVWSFTLAGRRPIRIASLGRLDCPVETRLADFSRLARLARFSRTERRLIATAPVNRIDAPCLMELLLNPCAASAGSNEFDLDSLMRAIPILHPHHTRTMIEALAEQVIGTVRRLDIERLVDALLLRADRLTADLKRELFRLKEFLRGSFARIDSWRLWSARLFAALVILMTLANAIAPDSAFAKGSAGIGHASMSRGYSGSFSGSRGFASSEPGGGSFGGAKGYGGTFGSDGSAATGGFGSAPAITRSGFRSGYGRGEAVDIYGYGYTPRTFTYCGGGYGHIHPNYIVNNGARPVPAPERHEALFVADDDMMVLDNGDVAITLSDTAFLLVTNGTIALFDKSTAEPLTALYADPKLFENIRLQISDQREVAGREADARRDWLGWVGWTSALFPVVQGDKRELSNIVDLERKLKTAVSRVGAPKPPGPPSAVAPNAVELFVGAFLNVDGNVALCQPDGSWLYTDGSSLWTDRSAARRPCPKVLTAALGGILKKLDRETIGDVNSTQNDLKQLASERASLYNDLTTYNSLQAQNGNDPNYEVDYGTDEIPVYDALNRTRRDIDANRADTITTQQQIEKLESDRGRIHAAADRFG